MGLVVFLYRVRNRFNGLVHRLAPKNKFPKPSTQDGNTGMHFPFNPSGQPNYNLATQSPASTSVGQHQQNQMAIFQPSSSAPSDFQSVHAGLQGVFKPNKKEPLASQWPSRASSTQNSKDILAFINSVDINVSSICISTIVLFVQFWSVVCYLEMFIQ